MNGQPDSVRFTQDRDVIRDTWSGAELLCVDAATARHTTGFLNESSDEDAAGTWLALIGAARRVTSQRSDRRIE